METTFYDEDDSFKGAFKDRSKVGLMKRTMTLDFNSNPSKKAKFAQLLQSPDLNLLKLASPELEKMIIQHNGTVTTTPTPTQFIYPKYVTDEQEAYAQGFVTALAELHGGLEGPNNNTSMASDVVSTMNNIQMPSSSSVPTYTTLSTTTNLPGSVITHTQNHQQPQGIINTISSGYQANPRLSQLKEELQIVPCGISPPLSPINMENQERIKLERKRSRNRVAARKCRTRKLERISRLEDKVKDLKGQNNDLSQTAQQLREQVFKLKQQIVEHANSGCTIMSGHNIQL